MAGEVVQDVLPSFQYGVWHAHPPQPAEMGSHTRPEGSMRDVPQPKLPTGLLHQRRKGGVIDMANAGEEVVLDLEIQPPNEP